MKTGAKRKNAPSELTSDKKIRETLYWVNTNCC